MADGSVHALRVLGDCANPAGPSARRGGTDGGRIPGRLGQPGQTPPWPGEGLPRRYRPKPSLQPPPCGPGEPPLEEDVLLLETDGPDKELDRRETARIVNAALSRLDKPQRELFVRHYYYGQTVQEAALAMGLNLSTAKTWLRRGRETLKTDLRKEGYGYETAGNLQADG